MGVSTRVGEHLRANVVGYVAVFIALSGTAFAVEKIGSKEIAKNAVKAKHIKDGQVSSAEVADNGLTGTDINEGTLQFPPVPNQLTDGSVTTPKLADGAVTEAKLADDAVTSAKVGPDALGAADINEADLNPGVLQRRVSGTCGPTAAVAAIAANGTTTCDQDDSLAVMTGRVSGLHPVGGVAYAGASGYTTANLTPGPVLTLSPNTTTTASGFSAKLTSPVDGYMEVSLLVNGDDTLVDCDITGGDFTTCNSGDNTTVIPPGATLALEIEHLSTIPPGDLLFGWTLR